MITLQPQKQIEPPQLSRGLQTLTREVMFSSTCDSIVMGAILTAVALHLGARPAQIGILTTVAFWAQLLQAPAVLLIERLRRRKMIAVIASFASSLAPASMAALAFSAASPAARIGLVAAVAVYCGAGALAGSAWNAWTRDLVPSDIRGRFFAQRSRLAVSAQIIIGLLAAAALEFTPEHGRGPVFAALFALAFVAQLFSATALARAPEPMMPPAPVQPERLFRLLATPLKDPKFRPLIHFNASWQFAVNLAQPFFTVFILQQLSLGIALAMAFTVVSQIANGWALKRWGPLADRFGSKSVLNVAAPVFILCIAAMIGAAQIGPRTLVIGYLVLVHLVMGVAAAGVSLATGAIALKLSPEGRAAPYLSANALISSAIGGLAPMFGGLTAEFFAARQVRLAVEWRGTLIDGELLGLSLTGWTFYFAFSALLGLLALHRLAAVREEGSLDRHHMTHEILVLGQARFARPRTGGGVDAPEDLSPDLIGDRPIPVTRG